jgi:hypothetical protein
VPAATVSSLTESAGDAGDGAGYRIEDHPHFKFQIRHDFRMIAGDAGDISGPRAATKEQSCRTLLNITRITRR